jgi:hypothetical protein
VTTAASNPIDAPGTDEKTWHTWATLKRLPTIDTSAWPSAVTLLVGHQEPDFLAEVYIRSGERAVSVAAAEGLV